MIPITRPVLQASRASEYFTTRELEAQTGQPSSNFVAVALKELADNALDAAETAGTPPQLTVRLSRVYARRCCRIQLRGRLGKNRRVFVPRWSKVMATRKTRRVLPSGLPVRAGRGRYGWTGWRLEVVDNGPGMAPDVVQKILDFSTRTSDKLAWRSPTRGAQGNALKTLLGLPWALSGQRLPIVLEARGVRHILRAGLDPAGEPEVDHRQEPCDRREGTRIVLRLPPVRWDGSLLWWLRAYALFNPHLRINGMEPVAAPDWPKYRPTDGTSPHWYQEDDLARLIFALLRAIERGDHPDLTLRAFVRQFRGLSGTRKAKAVCDRLPGVARLTDLKECPERIPELLHAMQEHSSPPAPETLGVIGAQAFRQRFGQWYGLPSPERFWYRRASALDGGVPYLFEVAVAEVDRPGDLFCGVNFAPAFGDPVADSDLRDAGDNWTWRWMRPTTIRHYLGERGCDPQRDRPPWVAAAVHIVSPRLEFLDRGKSRFRLPPAAAEALGRALRLTTQTLAQEMERRRRDEGRAERERELARQRAERSRRISFRDAVFEVLPQAWVEATGNGQYPVNRRGLWYAVRRILAPLQSRIQVNFTADAGGRVYNYFSQVLLTEYQQRHGPLAGLYSDPRGNLIEPHTGRTIALGTQAVETYEFPAWTFDKVLYIEKEGLLPILQAAKLAERYDMAIVSSKGYATEAARTLLARAQRGQDYQIFVLHDADPDGYGIARTLREATRRMPGHSIEVADLGLFIEEAIEMGLPTEPFDRKKALPATLELTEAERAYFTGRKVGPHSWIDCRRVELNAFTAPALIAYIERKLQEAGVRGKVIPPDDVLKALAQDAWREAIRARVDAAVSSRLEKVVRTLAKTLTAKAKLDRARALVEKALAEDPAQSWQDALREAAREGLAAHLDADSLDRAVRAAFS